MIYKAEEVGTVAREGTQPPAHFARTPLTGGKTRADHRDWFATSGQRCEDVATGWVVRFVHHGTGRNFFVDSQAVGCATRGSHVVLEGGGAGVSDVLIGYAGEGLVVLMGAAGSSSCWRCSSCAVQGCENGYVSGMH